jgi:hypothetical protein
MTSVSAPSTVEEHIAAMLEARTGSERVAVLRSALQHQFGGLLVACSRHNDVFTFAELRGHVKRAEHQPGDLTPAEADDRVLGAGGR